MFETSRPIGASTGVRLIDANWESLAFLLDQLFHPSVICAGSRKLCPRIEDTIRFLTRNLEREERLMGEAAYPGFAAHKREHDILRQKLVQMKSTLICSQYDNALVSRFLRDWTKNHTQTFDKPLGDFLRERGMEPVEGGGF
jgi:hemerythrin-like metal-binding protein